MTKTAGIVVVSLFVLGLCVAPFAIGAPAKQSKGDERKKFMST